MTDTRTMTSSDNPIKDVVAIIREQHQRVRALMNEIATAPATGRQPAFEELVRLLAVHETAEEMTVYPAISDMSAEGKRIAEERKEEEGEAKKVLSKLEGEDIGSDDFLNLFLTFRSDVETHAEQEEQEVLPLLAKSDEKGRTQMGRTFLMAEEMAPTHSHAMAPTSATGNVLVGPFVAMIDKVRDAIRDARR